MNICSFKNTITTSIYSETVLIEYIIIFENMFSDIEVSSFYLFLYRILEGIDIHGEIMNMLETEVARIVNIAQWEDQEVSLDWLIRVIEWVNTFAESAWLVADDFIGLTWFEAVTERALSLLSGKIEILRNTGTEEEFAEFERRLSLAAIDELWMSHIDSMAHLREEVAFEWYAQKNPLVIYKEKAYTKFVSLIETIGLRVTKWLLTAKPREAIEEVNLEENLLSRYAESAEAKFDMGALNAASHLGHTEYQGQASEWVRIIAANDDKNQGFVGIWRNDLCPCGSGKKFKQCHGK